MKEGQALGPYRIVRPLGAGGMGEVYLAEDSRLSRQVAIKVLPEGVAADPESRARLEQEARLLAQLEHPNVATLYGLEEAAPDGAGANVRHLVMQLADGMSLSDRLAGGPLPVDEALEIAAQVAAGVGAAHDKGIVHRDLKPGNVMVADGTGGRPAVKVLDFGLAKAAAADPHNSGSDLTASPTMAGATAAGVIMGTAAYMSPEQARGKPVDRRTDVWSFGCLLYEMLTGERAFPGETMSDIIAAILTRDPDWSALPAGLSRPGQRALRRCLARQADERPYDLRDVMFEMRALEPSGAAATAAPSSARGIHPLAALGVAVLAAVGAYFAGGMGLDDAVRPAGAPTRHTQITFHAGAEAFPTISADAEWVVYASRADGDWDIYLQAVGGDNAINLTEDSPADDWMPAMSPDGRQIAFRSERAGGGLYLMGRTGESVRRLTDYGYNPAWSPDGAAIAFVTEAVSDTPYARNSVSRLLVADVATSEVREIEVNDAMQPSFSPDGQSIVYWGIRGYDTGQRDLWIVGTDGGDPVQVIDDAPTDWSPVFTPEGDAIVFSSDRGGTPGLWRLGIDAATRQPRGEPELLVPGTSHWVAYPAFAAETGQLVYATMGAEIAIQQIELDSSMREVAGPARALTSGSRNAMSPDISPDGEWLAFSTGSGQQEDIYLQRIDGSATRRLTNDAFKDRAPKFSPDGRTIGFYASRDGNYQIWTIDIDGSNLYSVTGSIGAANFNYVVWSPAGDRIATTNGLADRTPVFINLAGATPTLEPFEVDTPAGYVFQASHWSPDGTRLVGTLIDETQGSDNHGATVYVVDTGEAWRVGDFGADHVWLNDSRHLAFNDNTDIWIADSTTGEQWQVLSAFPDTLIEYMAPLRDRPGVLFSRRRQQDDLWLADWQ